MIEVRTSRMSEIVGIQIIMTSGMTEVRIIMTPGMLDPIGVRDILIGTRDQAGHGVVGLTPNHVGKQPHPSGLGVQVKNGQTTRSGEMHRDLLDPPRYLGQ